MAYRLQDASVHVLGLLAGREVYSGTTQGVPAQSCVVLQAVAGTVLVHGQIADVPDIVTHIMHTLTHVDANSAMYEQCDGALRVS